MPFHAAAVGGGDRLFFVWMPFQGEIDCDCRGNGGEEAVGFGGGGGQEGGASEFDIGCMAN